MSSCASLIVRKVSVDVKQNLKKKKKAGFFFSQLLVFCSIPRKRN